MSNAKLTFRSALWNHAGKILEYLLMYVTSIVIARALGVVENGRFVGLFSLSQLLLAICSFGLETSLNKFIPQLEKVKQNEKVSFILRRAVLLRGLAFLSATIVLYLLILFLSVPFVSGNERILFWVFLFTAVRSVFPLFVTVLTAQLRTALTAQINLFIRTLELIGIVALTFYEFTVQSVFVVFLVSSCLHVTAYMLFSKLNVLGKSEAVAMKPILIFGGVYWINTIVDFILGRQGDVLFLTHLLPDSSQGGLYDVAYSIAQLASMAMTVGLAGVTFATFARLAVSDQRTMDRFYGFSIRIISLLTVPLYAFIVFNAEPLLTVLYSHQYAGAAVLVQGILLFRTASRLFGGPENGEYLLSHGRVWILVIIGIISATLNMCMNLVLIPKFGAMGSVIASGCGNLLVNLLGGLAVVRMSENRIQINFWLKIVGICFFSAFASRYFFPSRDGWTLIISGPFYVAAVLMFLFLVKPLAREDFLWLSKAIPQFTKVLKVFAQAELAA
jgi:O-antigen/teichoic acid export membrane protein